MFMAAEVSIISCATGTSPYPIMQGQPIVNVSTMVASLAAGKPAIDLDHEAATHACLVPEGRDEGGKAKVGGLSAPQASR